MKALGEVVVAKWGGRGQDRGGLVPYKPFCRCGATKYTVIAIVKAIRSSYINKSSKNNTGTLQ